MKLQCFAKNRPRNARAIVETKVTPFNGHGVVHIRAETTKHYYQFVFIM